MPVRCLRPGGAVHPVQVVAHRGQRAAEFLSDAGRLLGIPDAQTYSEPARVRLGELGSRGVHGLRRPGPDIADKGAEHRPLGRGQQHAELHKGILADDLIRPNRLIASIFQPPHGRTLQIGLRGAGERDRQANAHRPQRLASHHCWK
jgi:hypothetical protein